MEACCTYYLGIIIERSLGTRKKNNKVMKA